DDFGILAIYASLLAILVIIANLRYDFAIVVPRSTRAAANVAAISIATAATVSATVGLALIIWSRPLAEFLNAPLVGHYMWLLPISAFGAGVYQTLNYWAIRRRDYTRVAKTKAVQGVWMVGTQVGV